ncbi:MULTISPECIES: YfmQ family protein [Bacillus]|uniref:YfmQ n=1 Tax=Bacillus glycinifermentans TaxID=1664069 RepID=A0AAJ3YZ86_9BACI|nr:MULTISPECIES: YfmQ family protein [Bacillus]HWO78256.1 YfmQ family protein [Bacillus sp. (in: firmicutes)]KKB73079.1 hypothetical protein TH62_14725 [Bacillus sp. TH008]MDU0070726.1 YfmQ family protein [Bacillus sp. IG6]MED8018702.1 YfmQ family protein [Bacillus glycinifermentans]QAT66145.1 hypothetical protein EQZ20_15355 [Bacillus glycinifermentans]
MTWISITMLILLFLVKLVLTCLPSGVVEWISAKFEVHSKLSDENSTVTIGGKCLDGQDKKEVIQHFNEAVFMEKYYIFPGDEHLYLHPKDGGTPVVIDTKKGKKEMRLLIFTYNDRIDVVKQYKKKVIAYCLQSDYLQKQAAGNVV